MSLWVEQPSINYASGVITFTGGVPGGFSGSNGPVLSFVVKALKEGTGVIAPQDIKVLLNDGEGSEINDAVIKKLSIAVTKPAPKTIEKPEIAYIPPPDVTPPDPFMPLVSQHESIASNKYFVSFSAVDKDSGIGRYEIKEIPLYLPFGETNWATATSPYVLNKQLWPTKILVRAYDQSGNYRDGYAQKPVSPVLAWIIAIIISLLSIIIASFRVRRYKKYYRKTVSKTLKK